MLGSTRKYMDYLVKRRDKIQPLSKHERNKSPDFSPNVQARARAGPAKWIMAVSQQGKNLDSDFTLLYTNYVQKVCPEQPHILEIFELIGIYINVLLKSLRYAVFESIVIHRNIKSPQQGYEMQPVMG